MANSHCCNKTFVYSTNVFVFLGVGRSEVSWHRVLGGLIGGCSVRRSSVFRCGVSGPIVSIAGSGNGEESGDKKQLELETRYLEL